MESRALARVEKKAAQKGRTIVFLDLSRVYLLRMVVVMYAPCGCTPIMKEWFSYNHLSMIGAVTLQFRMFLKTYPHSITSREVVAFLRQLQRLIPGLLQVIWDGSPTYYCLANKDYLATGATRRRHLERFPGNFPELNPTEWVWSYLKLIELANIACNQLSESDAHLKKTKKRLKSKPNLTQAFIQDADYVVRLLCGYQ